MSSTNESKNTWFLFIIDFKSSQEQLNAIWDSSYARALLLFPFLREGCANWQVTYSLWKLLAACGLQFCHVHLLASIAKNAFATFCQFWTNLKFKPGNSKQTWEIWGCPIPSNNKVYMIGERSQCRRPGFDSPLSQVFLFPWARNFTLNAPWF